MREDRVKQKIKLKPVVSIQMIENGFIVFFEMKQEFFYKLPECYKYVNEIMSNYKETPDAK